MLLHALVLASATEKGVHVGGAADTSEGEVDRLRALRPGAERKGSEE
jgi:hypothetical protein